FLYCSLCATKNRTPPERVVFCSLCRECSNKFLRIIKDGILEDMATFVKKYNPDRSQDWNYGGPKWRLSRSTIDLFIECPRCFYIDNKLGTARPRGPAFTLNIAVDELFKKEFDAYRMSKTPHPIMVQHGVDAVPFQHKMIDAWRDNFVGIEHVHSETGLTVS